MRKLIGCMLAAVVIATGMPAMAVDFTLGAKAGYFVWEPYFKEMDGSGIEDVKTGSGVLYGPVASVLITPDVSFSIAGFFGNQSAFWSIENKRKIWGPDEILATGNYSADMKRMDIDSALSLKIMEKFKVFGGYKYQNVRARIEATFRSTEVVSGDDAVQQGFTKIETPSHGPALGIGYSSALTESIFMTVNASVLYMWSQFKISDEYWNTFTPSGPPPTLTSGGGGGETGNWDIQQIGLNIEPSVGAGIGGNVIATLGLRFQWMRIKFIDDFDYAPSGWMNDYLYGVFVSVLYTI